eukprot:TRINITY_DN6112_c0_g1_i1.p1 TRINITY_DN6112_c0_g1~~TRINITY_DN6112_c0_g1_i1.p1  ORF type:complete len:423 (-),score=95.28 TRINITY_DN6112_c0_g1_i1:34-1302(-)
MKEKEAVVSTQSTGIIRMQGRKAYIVVCFSVLVLALFFNPVSAKGWFDDTSVRVLTEKNIDEFVKSKDGVVIFYYTPGNKDCKSIKSNLINAAESLDYERESGRHAKRAGLAFGAMDCSKEVKACMKYDIKEFPAIRYYINGKEEFEYHHLTRSEALLEFLQTPGLPPIQKGPGMWGEKLNGVLHLTKGNFTKFINKYNNVLVMFYAQWCGHCKALKPHYMDASAEVRAFDKGYLTAIDCGENQDICSQYGVKSYPTLKFFDEGKVKYEYDHGRKKEDLINFMRSPSPPPVQPPPEPKWKQIESDVMHLNDDNFENFIQENPSTFVMFYAPWCSHCKAMKPAYQEAATEVKKGKYGVLAAIDCDENKGVSSRYEIKGFPTLKYFKDGKSVDYSGARTKEALVEFMRSPVLPKQESAPPKEEL